MQRLREAVAAGLIQERDQGRPTSQLETVEVELFRKDDTSFPAEIVMSFIREEGKITGVLGVTRDISERVKAESGFRAIFDQAAIGVAQLDPMTGAYIQVNQRYLEILGRRVDEVIGFTSPDMTHVDDHAEDLRLTSKLLTGTIREFSREKRYFKPNGDVIWVNVTIAPMWKEGDAPTHCVAVVEDITERRKTEERLRESEGQLQQSQKMEAIGTLAGGIAHDFNNILQAILDFCNIMQESQNREEEFLQRCLGEIEKGGRRASELVSQILTFSRVSEVNFRPHRLAGLLQETLKFMRGSLPATIDIESTFDPVCGKVMCDITQMHQVLTNLCTNAYHAMEDRGGVLTITLEQVTLHDTLDTLSGPIPAGRYVRLSVSDTGVGIEPAIQRRLLDPFFTTKDVGKGTGLGLAMVHGIVKGMKGGLLIESEVGAGTRVQALFQEASGVLEETEVINPGTIPQNGIGHLLLVDDEEGIARLMKIQLENRGYTVNTFNDPLLVIEEYLKHGSEYDLVLLDYTMPKMNGIDLAHELLAINPALPIILCSGVLDYGSSAREKAQGISAILKKPYDVNQLLAAINRALGTVATDPA